MVSNNITPMWAILIFSCVLYIVYIAWYIFKPTSYEGMSNINADNQSNGVGGNSDEYVSKIKDKVVQLQDSLLTSKYANNYENIVISADELVDNLMLRAVLNIDPASPHKQLDALNTLHASKQSLNSVMKFIGDK